MSRLKDRLLNYHIQVKKFADDDQMILANDVLSMIEQLQDDLEWYEKPKLTKTEKSFIEALDPSWSYMLRNGKGQLYLARKVDSMYGSNFKYLYLEGITDLDNLDESDWIRVNDEMPVERDSMFAKFKGTNKWKTGMFEKVSRNVLVTVEYDNGERHTEVAHTVDGRWKLEMRILNAKVIAWKEKPQPYKGDKNVSNM